MLKLLGKDLAKDKIEFLPKGVIGGLHSGGVRVDENGECGVPGLNVAGSTGDFCGGGLDGSPASTLSGCSAHGYLAGESAHATCTKNT